MTRDHVFVLTRLELHTGQLIVKGWPACTGVKFLARYEERSLARCTALDASDKGPPCFQKTKHVQDSALLMGKKLNTLPAQAKVPGRFSCSYTYNMHRTYTFNKSQALESMRQVNAFIRTPSLNQRGP